MADFTVSPDVIREYTQAIFDASLSRDNEDPLELLEVRWDWQNDGIWDTPYSGNKQIMHTFNLEGVRLVVLEVKDSHGITDTTTKKIFVGPYNRPPVARFSIRPDSGTVDTVFTFDASLSSDSQTIDYFLEVRWDWQDDGVMDTEFTTTKTATHQFDSPGLKSIRLEVLDDWGATSSLVKQLVVSP